METKTNPHTMTITEIIEKAAKEYARKWHQSNPDEFKNPDASPRADFTAGASFATSDPSVLTELLGKFAEWIRKDYWMEDTNFDKWVHASNGEKLNDEQLIAKYIQETIKPKEDELPQKTV